MRVLFLLSHAGHTRNFESALRVLAERDHETTIVVDRLESQSGIRNDEPLRSLCAEYGSRIRVVVCRMPAWHPASAPGVVLRGYEDYLRYLEPVYAGAPLLRERAAASAWLGHRRDPPRSLRGAATRRRLSTALHGFERRIPPRSLTRRLLAAERPDVLVATPLVEFRSRQVEWLRAAAGAGIPTVFPVASWDNLTVKGSLHHHPDVVTVWNDLQRDEAIRLHGVRPDSIRITGALAYDHWFATRPSTSRSEFLRRVGLPAERPYLLYLCSSPFIAPAEADYVVDWVRGVRASPLLGDRAGVLVRQHPHAQFDVEHRAELERIGGVSLFPAAPTNPVSSHSRADYFDSIHHSAAVIAINTSGFIESAILGRPGFTYLTDRYRRTQEQLLHFAYLVEENGGPARIARSFAEHAEQLARSLAGEEDRTPRLEAFVERFVRPFGLDQPAAPRLVDAIETFAR